MASIISRRTMLARAAAATVTGPIALANGSDAHTDTRLVQLGRELEASWAAEKAVCAIEPIDEAACDAAIECTSAIVDQIKRCAARTMAGLRVKAQAIAWCHGGAPHIENETTDLQLAQTIVEDLLRVHHS